MRHIYKNETDHFSAESAEQANELQCKIYGLTRDEVDLFEEPPMPEEEVVTVLVETKGDCPGWVESEPEAQLVAARLGEQRLWKVSAPARVWAKHEEGCIASTEF